MLSGIGPYEIFLKVVELKNITRAAEVLNYTQSGVSHAIASLEDEMGFSLFTRYKKGVELTQDGEAVVDAVRSLVNQYHNLAQTIAVVKDEVAGTIRIGVYLSISVTWMPHMIRAFKALYPKVNFELQHANQDEILRWLAEGRVDCGFIAEPAETVKQIRFYPLYKDPMIVALPDNHPLSAKESLTLEDVKNEPFVLPKKGYDADIQRVLAPIQSDIKNYIICDDVAMMAMIYSGFGVGIIPNMFLRIYNYGIVARPLTPPHHRTLGAAALPPEKVSATTRRFLSFIVEEQAVNLDIL